jgi:hypothetical protein
MTTTTTLAPSVGRRVWRPGLVAAGTAALANLALFAASRAAGVSYLVRFSPDADPTRVTAAHVALTTLVPFVAGLAVAVVAARHLRHGLRTVQVLGAALAVVSLAGPLSLEADTAARLVLAAMHVVTGAAFAVALGRARAA